MWIHPVPSPPSGHPFVTENGVAFLPDDAIANVHLERYVDAVVTSAGRTELLKKIYYLMKPLMPRSVQLSAQRMNARSRLRTVSFPEWPQDDSLNRFLGAALATIVETTGRMRVPFIGFWPRGHRWAACLTHDVEGTEGLRAMDRMAKIEEAHGIRSTWYIVPERYPVSPADFHAIRERGHEIGVHGLSHAGKLFSSREAFDDRAPQVNKYIREWGAVGFRSPVLYRNP